MLTTRSTVRFKSQAWLFSFAIFESLLVLDCFALSAAMSNLVVISATLTYGGHRFADVFEAVKNGLQIGAGVARLASLLIENEIRTSLEVKKFKRLKS